VFNRNINHLNDYVYIDNDEQLLHLTRYIHLNPTSAGLVENPEDWDRSFIHPNLVHQLSNNVKEFLSDNVKENACQ
jgi:hypothetical protein